MEGQETVASMEIPARPDGDGSRGSGDGSGVAGEAFFIDEAVLSSTDSAVLSVVEFPPSNKCPW